VKVDQKRLSSVLLESLLLPGRQSFLIGRLVLFVPVRLIYWFISDTKKNE
jgi:hypothetical protein